MEYLKHAILSIFILTSLSLPAFAQQSLSDAFNASYESENAGNLETAIEVLDSVYDAESYELNLRLGWLHYQKGDMDESIVYYKRSVDLKPYAIEPKLGLAYPYSSMAMWDEIIELYDKILETDPQNSLVNYRLGLIYYNRGQYERADGYIEKTVNLYPFDYDSLLLFAWNKLMMQRTREAKVLFEKVLLANPGDESAMNGLSLIQ
ncbi:MAG: tetratricopeptide repeat protein [Rhodohalobacter sp.]|uniref:tetratricopeptide repeat protein n=1 Tax=Rhodohalobacter sp. TaxID=1974210 RepID=UPI003974DF26